MDKQLSSSRNTYPDFGESGENKTKQAVRCTQEPCDHTGSI